MRNGNADDEIIRLASVSFHYEDKHVLDQVNLELFRGDFVGIVGPNGSGKSTLMKLILGLLTPTAGRILLFGQPQERFRDWSKVGYVAQQAAHGAGGFPATVREVVSSGLVGKLGLFRRLKPADREKVAAVVERVGLADKLDKRIGSLSGGQLQRVFIARALVADPELLILDEPTVGVDQESIEQFYELLRSLKDEHKMTMMIVSHDVGMMTQWVNKVACLQHTLHLHSKHEFEHHQEEILQVMYGDTVRVLAHHH
ncbi:metal ABC transporter ATP-binding protein [Brevibacillus fulvus]|uniref:Zinc transport system ATP-binding protein n=1 Tax=Brevibacillus fulvus TaxID=1125967 RepID=A0A938Y2N6_9BACL|nr:metal ABC transporter ATP-binding protein [Brevibacillus fulvus]MBM7592190.1 zinc transport system ATP-binding protein [Brevibacillus fulvus]